MSENADFVVIEGVLLLLLISALKKKKSKDILGVGKCATKGFDVRMEFFLLPKDYRCRKSFLFSNSSKGRFVKMKMKQSSELYLEILRKFSLCLEAGPALNSSLQTWCDLLKLSASLINSPNHPWECRMLCFEKRCVIFFILGVFSLRQAGGMV